METRHEGFVWSFAGEHCRAGKKWRRRRAEDVNTPVTGDNERTRFLDKMNDSNFGAAGVDEVPFLTAIADILLFVVLLVGALTMWSLLEIFTLAVLTWLCVKSHVKSCDDCKEISHGGVEQSNVWQWVWETSDIKGAGRLHGTSNDVRKKYYRSISEGLSYTLM